MLICLLQFISMKYFDGIRYCPIKANASQLVRSSEEDLTLN